MANKGGFLLGAIVGAAAAGITALLYAPKSGKELREELNQQTTNAKGSAKEYADIAKESSEYTKQQILQQAASSLLVQANQAPSIALNLV
mgnify:CR=1 FL=1